MQYTHDIIPFDCWSQPVVHLFFKEFHDFTQEHLDVYLPWNEMSRWQAALWLLLDQLGEGDDGLVDADVGATATAAAAAALLRVHARLLTQVAVFVAENVSLNWRLILDFIDHKVSLTIRIFGQFLGRFVMVIKWHIVLQKG